MIIAQAKDLSKSYGTDLIFEQVNFTMHAGEKVGLVGVNGAGKTTLFKCLTGEILPDTGEISFSEQKTLGYLEQLPEYGPEITLFSVVVGSCTEILELRDKLSILEKQMAQVFGAQLDKVMEQYSSLTERYERAGGYGLETKVRRIVKGLGFKDEDLNRQVNVFSGGEKTRVSLAKLLVQEPDLLLLDEPTNHLDIAAVEWLENFLQGYPGAVLVISHDRYFLDQVVNRVLELENHRLQSFNGNYSRYLRLKEEQVLAQTRAYEKQQAEIARTEAYIERYRAGIKAKQARGRQSQLERLERVEKAHTNQQMRLSSYAVSGSGEIVLSVKNLTKSFGEKRIFEDLSFTLRKQEKVGIIGGNGVGKSTLLKMLMGQVSGAGDIYTGSRVKVAYYDQEQQNLNPRYRLLDEIMLEFGLPEGIARNHLASVIFTGDDVYKLVDDLSGGERARLAFLKIILTGANFLILDEPTNHLDILSKEIIEAFLQEYQGTVLFVSHDRYFVDQLADRVLEIEVGQIHEYLGNYSYYKAKKAAWEQEKAEAAAQAEQAKKAQQTKQTRSGKSKEAKRIAELEAAISAQEAELEELGQQLADPEVYQDETQAKQLVLQYKSLEENIGQAYAEWEALLESCAD